MLFSTVLFTSVFLTINHLYSTFASPTVPKGDVGESLNLTHQLVKRDYIPPDQLCDAPAHWVRRVCRTEFGDRAWSDSCRVVDFYWRMGACPLNTMCQNTLADNGLKQTINCVDRPTTSSRSAPDHQCGVYKAGNRGSTDPAERIISVTLDSNYADATVSAFMEGILNPH
jgi:hypothetical protein